MFGRPITFDDLDGNSRTETFWFHLSKAEIATMEMSADGGSLAKNLMAVIARQDAGLLLKTFETIIRKAYGVRSEDGIRFIKSEELSDGFLQTDAFSELFMELLQDEGKAAEFINGIVPKEVRDHMPSQEDDKNVQNALTKLRAVRETVNIDEVITEAKKANPALGAEIEKNINQDFPELRQRPHVLPDAGEGFVIDFGPFTGLTQKQVDELQNTGLLAQYLTAPDSFEK